MTNSDDLLNILRSALLAYEQSKSISPEVLADEAYRRIDPEKVAPPLVGFSCILNLRQMGRHLLRHEYEKPEETSTQGELFTGLQDRYPGTGDNKGLYVPRLQMSYSDRMVNIERLRKEARAKMAHADALEIETETLLAQGLLEAEQLSAYQMEF